MWIGFCGYDFGEPSKVAYVKHYEHVRKIVPKENLLEFDVAKDDWTMLATFLDKPVPEGDFPNVNDTANFRKMSKLLMVSLVV
jgi:Sulfotransferase domain